MAIPKYMSFKAACIQMNSGGDMNANLTQLEKLIGKAAAKGAHFIVTPEYTNLLFDDMADAIPVVLPQAHDITLARCRELARDLRVWIHIGSLALKESSDKISNRSFLIDADGNIVSTYDKVHLFDTNTPDGNVHRESAGVVRGQEVKVVETPFGNIGMGICYDLRFSDQFKEMMMAGAEIFVLPAAYTVPSGERTWEAFLMARAAENGCFVIAAGQCADEGFGGCWGHSMIVSPWGPIIARTPAGATGKADKEAGVVVAELKRTELDQARAAYPVADQTNESPYRIIVVKESYQRKISAPQPG